MCLWLQCKDTPEESDSPSLLTSSLSFEHSFFLFYTNIGYPGFLQGLLCC